MSATLTAPIVKTSFNASKRSYKTSFTFDNGYRINVSTYHNKDRKQYVAYCSLVEYEDKPNVTVERSVGSLFDQTFAYYFVSPVSVDRYSQKNLEAEHKNNVLQFKYEQLAKYEAFMQSRPVSASL